MRTLLLVSLLCSVAVPTFADDLVDVNYFSTPSDKSVFFSAPGTRIRQTPPWDPQADAPPLAPRKAVRAAQESFRKYVLDDPLWRDPAEAAKWKMDRIVLEDAGDGRHWYYVVEYPHHGVYAGKPPDLRVIVLMDGTVAESVAKILPF